MNHILENSIIGIDAVIQKVQVDLYDQLINLWVGKSIDGYGRAYKNYLNGGYVPEHYVSGQGYQDVLLNDNVDGHFAFLVSDSSTTDDDFVYVNQTKVVFSLNLKNIYPESGEYEDERAHRDTISILREISKSKFNITGFQTEVESVYAGYDIKMETLNNLYPYHIFAVNVDLKFNINDKC